MLKKQTDCIERKSERYIWGYTVAIDVQKEEHLSNLVPYHRSTNSTELLFRHEIIKWTTQTTEQEWREIMNLNVYYMNIKYIKVVIYRILRWNWND